MVYQELTHPQPLHPLDFVKIFSQVGLAEMSNYSGGSNLFSESQRIR